MLFCVEFRFKISQNHLYMKEREERNLIQKIYERRVVVGYIGGEKVIDKRTPIALFERSF
ncbi:hypothetical protein SHANETTE_19 [Bacillus phage Shanette]|uniref:Uncharacterized protein n=1 Tax=Bacillus phage Shanette TaxID=1296656 RepID=S5MBF2_9CAUD|nr:hypothetical protein AVV46_gp019 [Bacillus phage Shanette]AGR47139.1 hypothetical protein SHANETTE_19 [Bacillus phage Shanette]